jgi:hypothetical protein
VKKQLDLEGLEIVMKTVDSVKEEIDRVSSSIDWEAQADRVAEAAFRKAGAASRKPRRAGLFARVFPLKWRPVYGGLAAGIMIGFLGAYLVLKPGLMKPGREEKLFASREFIEKVELEMTRRETLDYLEKSQYVLLDFVRTPAGEARMEPLSPVRTQAKDLLTKKKYLNSELDKFQMAKARQICDQIEMLFYELSQIDSRLSTAELQRIQKLIQERQLLLKIKLVKKELEKSEV